MPPVPTITPNLTEAHFDEIESSINDIFNFFNNEFIPAVDFENKNTALLEKIKLEEAVVHDLFVCYNGLGYSLDFEKPESVALMIVFGGSWINNPLVFYKITYDNVDELSRYYKRKTKDYLKIYYNILTDKNYGSILYGLQKNRHELLSKYVVLLYRFTSLIAKTDGTVSDKEAEWLKTIMSWKEKTVENEDEILKSNSVNKKISSESQLDELIGLETVKQQVRTLKNFIIIQKQREQQGMKTTPVAYHYVFSGNPGTGKTTVARIVAKIYKELGVLKKGHLVETDRSGLVAEYVGQTAVKTNKIINSALDGVLFIDEAYSLVNGSSTDYGKEAIATLVKRMEDDRDRLVVILAGYKDDMLRFLDSNPGLHSRFNRHIDFPDYTADELYQIFEVNCKKFEYTLSEGAAAKLKVIINNAVLTKDKGFGNGRYVRNLFEKTIENQANRLSTVGNLSKEILSKIEEEDLNPA